MGLWRMAEALSAGGHRDINGQSHQAGADDI